MILNNEKENLNYNFLTELKLVKSSSFRKINRKLEANRNEKKITKSKSRFKSRSKNRNKKKKISDRIKILFLNKLNRKSEKQFDKKNIDYQFKIIFGKIIVKKKYLEQIVKRRQMYSEKVKKIKILKRNESIKPKEDTQLDLIKRYSFKVLCNNRAVINSKKEKDLLDKSENPNQSGLKSAILETPEKITKIKFTTNFKKIQSLILIIHQKLQKIKLY